MGQEAAIVPVSQHTTLLISIDSRVLYPAVVGLGSEGSGSECTLIMFSVSSGESTSSSCERQRTDSIRVTFSQRAFLVWPSFSPCPRFLI